MKVRYIFDRVCLERVNFSFLRTLTCLKAAFRDRPFNLKGGGYGFLFRSEFCFPTTRELEYLLFLSRKARNIFPEINIRLYDKNSESDYFCFPPPKSEYFFQQHWESEYFFRKKHTPPPPPPFKLNGRSLTMLSI